MTSHRLLLRCTEKQFKSLSKQDFLWRPRGEPSSMETNIGPRLEELGPVPPLCIDFVRLAVLVFLADRSSFRNRGKGLRWDRDLDLLVPVSTPTLWDSFGQDLAGHLHTLTGDRWSLSFAKERPPRRRRTAEVEPAPLVCLFSGGADSLAGAIAAMTSTKSPPVLVSHWDFPAVSGVQSNLVDELEGLWGVRPTHHRIEVTRWKKQVGSGLKFDNEKSRRSRSLLFIALGVAVAATRGADLWMCENGFTSINPPLAPERRGSLTTRTTHPRFLDELMETLNLIGVPVSLTNPWEQMTKGEVLRAAAKMLPPGVAETLLSQSHSCGKPSWFKGFSQGQHCGLCFGCLVRRGAMLASGIEDRTVYIETSLRGLPAHSEFVTPTRRKTVEAVRYRLGRQYDVRDILGMSLPGRINMADAVSLAQRGLDELRPVVQSIPR